MGSPEAAMVPVYERDTSRVLGRRPGFFGERRAQGTCSHAQREESDFDRLSAGGLVEKRNGKLRA